MTESVYKLPESYSFKSIWRITFPILVALVMEELLGMTDTAFLGRVGEIELGASAIAGVYFNPNIAYYVKLADRFYLTPEIGGGYELGSFKQRYASAVLVNGKYNGYYNYFTPFQIEFKVNPRFSIGIVSVIFLAYAISAR